MTTDINTFFTSVIEGYESMFGDKGRRYASVFADIAQPTLSEFDCCDAPYHNLDHTLKVVIAGQFLLQGKQQYEGSVSPQDWLHVLVALLHHDIGYLKGICQGDRPDLNRYADGKGGYVELPTHATGAALRQYHVDRGKAYAAERLSTNLHLDIARVQSYIEATRFPVPCNSTDTDISNYGSLCRAADLIGQFSDSTYLQKLPKLFSEFEETGMNARLGYKNPEELRAGYPTFYEQRVYPYVWPKINYLGVTPQGIKLISRLHANILAA